jgi:hypothetical protein
MDRENIYINEEYLPIEKYIWNLQVRSAIIQYALTSILPIGSRNARASRRNGARAKDDIMRGLPYSSQ